MSFLSIFFNICLNLFHSFPSPRVIKKSQTFTTIANKTDTAIPPPQTPPSHNKSQPFMRTISASMLVGGSPRQQTSSQSAKGIIKEPILQLPTVKRLFMSPGRPTKSMTATTTTTLAVNNSTTGTATTTTATALSTSTTSSSSANSLTSSTTTNESGNFKQPESNISSRLFSNQRPLTPLNKIRGLFSAYRDRLDISPLPSQMNERNSRKDGSPSSNLSLLNISDTTDCLT